jgi:hypothetical protein
VITWTDQTVGVNCRVSLHSVDVLRLCGAGDTADTETKVTNASQVISEMLGLPNEASVITETNTVSTGSSLAGNVRMNGARKAAKRARMSNRRAPQIRSRGPRLARFENRTENPDRI